MKGLIRTVVVAASAALAMSACHGGGSSLPASSHTSAIPAYTGPATLANFAWGRNTLSQAAYVGPMTSDVTMTLHVALKLQSETGLLQYAKAANTPGNGLYRNFLNAQEIGQRYGASAANEATVAKYFIGYGLTVNVWPQRLMVTVTGLKSQFQRAFGTTFGMYRNAAGVTFLGPTTAPHTTIALAIRAVPNMLYGLRIAQRDLILNGITTGSMYGYTPQQLEEGLQEATAASVGYNGTGIRLGIIGTGPIIIGGANGDVSNLETFTHSTLGTIKQLNVVYQAATAQNGYTGSAGEDPIGGVNLTTPPPPSTATCEWPVVTIEGGAYIGYNYQVCNPEDIEAQLDTEQTTSLAPGAETDFYLAYERTCVNTTSGQYATPSPAPNTCPAGTVIDDSIGIDLADDEIQQAIADDDVDTISMSYGEGENTIEDFGYSDGPGTNTGYGPDEFAALAAEGIAAFASSGDNGSDSCENPNTGASQNGYCVSYPASDPNVVGVGGVNLPLTSAGQFYPGSEITTWGDETTAGGNGTFENNVGSGGGVSTFFTTPSYQSGVSTTSPNPTLGGWRGVPDVAVDADPDSGPLVAIGAYFEGGQSGSNYVETYEGTVGGDVGGTSAAAPEMNALWGDVLSACKTSSTCATANVAAGTDGIQHKWRLGNPNYILYALAQNGHNGYDYAQTFIDVQFGENGAEATPGSSKIFQGNCCYATTGYDLTTGWGVPMIPNIINSVLNRAAVP
jgi:kumamolisin